MKPYSLRYVARQATPGNARMWRISILEKCRGDDGLLAHELVHVAEWYAWTALVAAFGMLGWWLSGPAWLLLVALAPFVQGIVYRWRWYRRISESLAYRVQLRTGHSDGVPYSSPEFAVKALMKLGMSRKEAERALR